MATTTEYTAAAGDTFDAIALAAYNEEKMASVLIQANPKLNDVLIFEGGEKISIPAVSRVTTADSMPPWRR